MYTSSPAPSHGFPFYYACGKFGHFDCVCRRIQQTGQRQVRMLDTDEDDDSFLQLFQGSVTINGIAESTSSDLPHSQTWLLKHSREWPRRELET